MAPQLASGVVLIMSLLLAAGPAAANPAAPRMIRADEAAVWNGVGRLNIAGNRLCTATLISPDEAITAAHCLFHPVTRHRAEPAAIRFVAGFRQDSSAAVLDVTATAILPAYIYHGPQADVTEVSSDLALLHLSRPVLPTEAVPLTVQDWPETATVVDIVGYGRDRPQIASIRQGCLAGDRMLGARLLDCPVLPGLSGAPVVLTGGQVMVAVVSASVGTRVAGVQALLVPVAPHLAELRALIP